MKELIADKRVCRNIENSCFAKNIEWATEYFKKPLEFKSHSLLNLKDKYNNTFIK